MVCTTKQTLLLTAGIVSLLQTTLVCCFTIPTLDKGIPAATVVSITTTHITTAEDNKEEASGTTPAPYEELTNGNEKLVKEIMAGLNRTPLGQMQERVNLYYSKNQNEAIEYCEQIVMTAFNGSLSQVKDGCNFSLECTYDPLRFPSLLLTGSCVHSYQRCGEFPDIKSCITHDIRVSVLNYTPTNDNNVDGYRQSNKDTIQGPVEWEWVEQKQLLAIDCLCEF